MLTDAGLRNGNSGNGGPKENRKREEIRLKILLILAAMAAVLALACAGEEPAPTLRPLAPAQPPTAAPTPTPVPTATPLPESVGICYRTPEVQDWIIQQLQIPSCRVITEPELYRITEPLGSHYRARNGSNAPIILKPGDLAGLANVSSLTIGDGHCKDWENPEYAASILDGLNPEAEIAIQSYIGWGSGEWPRDEVVSRAIYGDVETAEQVGIGELSDTQVESLIKRGQGLKRRANTQARAIAAAVAQSRGKENPLIRIPSVGNAVVGNPQEQEPGSIGVNVALTQHNHGEIPECAE